MKKVLFYLLLLCIPFVLTSCWTTEYIPCQSEYNQTWINTTKSDIIRQIGAPNRILSMDDGESILVYESYNYVTNNEGSSTSFAVPSNGIFGNAVLVNSTTSGVSNTSEKRSFAEFFINKEGKCYMVKTNHARAIKKNRPGRTIILVSAITIVAGNALYHIISGK